LHERHPVEGVVSRIRGTLVTNGYGSRGSLDRHRACAIAIFCCCVGLSVACSTHGSSSSSAPPGAVARAYPQGRWRLAPFADLRGVVLWVSHIVVMHRASMPSASRLRPPHWVPDTIPSRSPEEAYRIACGVKARAQAHPEQFAELAREVSDDVVTRDLGGSLGGARASELPAPFLDALALLQPGQVSEVIQTALGFHVLLKRAPPAPEDVRGVRLVVRYDSTAGEDPSARRRDEALELAKSFAERARSGADFQSLVSQHSEDRDRARLGDMGVWSTLDPSYDSTVTEALARLRAGEVSNPLDTQWGFQVVQRLPLIPRAEFGMRSLRIEYARGNAESERAAADTAQKVAAAVRADPGLFESYQARYCCRRPERWTDGHGDPDLTSALERLRVGEVAPEPVRLPYYYVIPQRLDPNLMRESPPPTHTLPSPDGPDMESAIQGSSSQTLAESVGEVRMMLDALKLSSPERDVVGRSLEQFRSEVARAETPESRTSAYHRSMSLLHDGVSESTYAVITTHLERWVTTQLQTNAIAE
jgi:hypothetical protein